ncbi:MAG: hypothetical protein IJ746_04360 [Ruminococcus sp.]|nr:hypothetical protein [Ruminococcus sp.]
MKFDVKISSKPEKLIIAATISVVLSIIFDEQKKKIKRPQKYNNFPKRVKKNYQLVDKLLKKTLAKELYDTAVHYNDPVLEGLTIENGEFIDL